MFVKETKSEILGIVKNQLEDIKNLKSEISSRDDYELEGTNYAYEGDKKTILKPAQGNSTKLAIIAQTCLFQLIQQIDSLRDQIFSPQKKKDPPAIKDLLNIVAGFLNATKTIKSREEFREIFGVKN